MSFHPEKIPLQLIINNAFEATMTMAQKKQICITILSGENQMVMADANMINTVLRNMMTNAIKFTATGGNITLQTEIVQNKARILVKDDGIGIDSQRIANLFNITERNSHPGTNNEPGTGLGLILCKEFVEKHGGDIMIESAENKGSVFSFTLPLVLNKN
jgi:signal transduction histidine kinase